MSDGWHFAFNLACAVYVVAFAGLLGFDRPRSYRSYTTLARYYGAASGYAFASILSMLLFFIVLQTSAHLSDGEIAIFPRSTMIWVACAITLALFGIIGIGTSLRSFLQRIAGVPEQVLLLGQALEAAKLRREGDRAETARSLLESKGIDVVGHWFSDAQTAQDLILKATTAFIGLCSFEADPRFIRFAVDAKEDIERIKKRFDRLSLRVARTFGSIQNMGSIRHAISLNSVCSQGLNEKTDPIIHQIVSDLLVDVCTDVSLFYSEVCLLIARGVMSSNLTEDARQASFDAVGFDLVEKEKPARINHWVFVLAALLLYLSIEVCLSLIGHTRDINFDNVFTTLCPAQDLPTPLLGILITLIQVGALAMAIVPKTRWAFASAALEPRAPWAFVIGCGLAAVMFAIVLNVIAGYLYNGLQGVSNRLIIGGPFLFSAFATAATTAWLIQDHRWRIASPTNFLTRARAAGPVGSPSLRRIYDSATMAAAWLSASIAGSSVKQAFCGDPGPITWAITIAFGLGVGAVLGYYVPSTFRIRDSNPSPFRSLPWAQRPSEKPLH